MPSYAIALSVAGPLMATGLESSAYGIDSPFLRDAEGRRYVLPGTQLRGILRHTLTAMAKAAPDKLGAELIDELFGRASGQATERAFERDPAGWEPRPGILFISDLAASEEVPDTPLTMTRVAVDDFTGSVREGHLQVLEQPARIGQTLIFEGTLSVRADKETAEKYVDWIAEALKLVPAIGANKSAGFGRVVAAPRPRALSEATPAPNLPASQVNDLAASGMVEVTLEFDGPFLISAERWNSNLISGQSRVPGSALKAVVAEMMGATHESHPLHDVVSRTVFRELRPAKPGNERPRTAPLCLFAPEGEDSIINAFDEDPEYYIAMGASSIAFMPDLKPGSSVMAMLRAKLGETLVPERHVRTRTAISAKGIAESGQLFTYSSIKPGGHVWKGSIHRGSATVDDFASLLSAMPSRVEGFGKTRVGAKLTLGPAEMAGGDVADGTIQIVLETPACLHAPEDFDDFANVVDPAERLRRQYQRYFADALRAAAEPGMIQFSDEDLHLRHFASQSRVGGYLAIRYPVSDEGYLPWVLTAAGSAFEFRVPKGLEAAVGRLLNEGLPVARGFSGKRRSWRGNPFVPENGFAEIRLIRDV